MGQTRKKKSKLRRRYGHAWASESAISQPRGDGLYDVVLVDGRGTLIRAIARGVPYGEATSIIRRRHG